jgi:hypothetical protein
VWDLTYDFSSMLSKRSQNSTLQQSKPGQAPDNHCCVSPTKLVIPYHFLVQPTVFIPQKLLSTRINHPSRQRAHLETSTSKSVVARSSCTAAAVCLVVILESRDAPASLRLQLVDLLPLLLVDLTQLEHIKKADDVIRQ